MTARNFEPLKKRDLVRAAASELPRVITAHHNGTCTECQTGFVAGTPIRRSNTGWMHAGCMIRPADTDLHQRMAERRERLRATKGTAAH